MNEEEQTLVTTLWIIIDLLCVNYAYNVEVEEVEEEEETSVYVRAQNS